MTLVDSIIAQGLNQFKSVTIAPKYPEWFKPQHSNLVFTYEQVRQWTEEQLAEIEQIRATAIAEAKENQYHNMRLMQAFRAQIADLLRAFGVDVCKKNKDIDFMYAHYEKIFDDIEAKNRIKINTNTEARLQVHYQGVTYTNSGNSLQSAYQRVMSDVSSEVMRYKTKRIELVEAITYLIENGISPYSFETDEAIIEAVYQAHRDSAIQKKYPRGRESTAYHKGNMFTYVHGELVSTDTKFQIRYGIIGRQLDKIRVNMISYDHDAVIPNDPEIVAYPATQ